MKYQFIDGAFFFAFVRDMENRLKAEIGQYNTEITFNRVRNSDRAFFYYALPVQKEGEDDAHFTERLKETRNVLQNIAETPRWQVRAGLTRKGEDKKKLGQKGVDTLLALECYQHAISGNMQLAEIWTCDLDFYPLFEALIGTQTVSQLCYQVRKTSSDLIISADEAQSLSMGLYLNWLKDGNLVREKIRKVCMDKIDPENDFIIGSVSINNKEYPVNLTNSYGYTVEFEGRTYVDQAICLLEDQLTSRFGTVIKVDVK